MKLIADSGATKANWVAVVDGQARQRFQTPGISPYFLDDAGIAATVREVRQALPGSYAAVHFYSTGCKAAEQRQRVTTLLATLFPESTAVQVETDLLGAARAVAQRAPGVVGILGTGSNACRYDGRQITSTAGGLGFILGDEGSGAAIGKALIMDYLNQQLPPALAQELEASHHLTRDNILQAVYQLPYPNRFLATFAPFVHQHRQEPSLQTLLEGQFRAFFRHSILVDGHPGTLPVHFVGSIAHYFADELRAVAQALGLELGQIQADPLPGLVAYHH